MPSILVGISPLTKGLIEYITQNVTSVDGMPLLWNEDHSEVYDEERNYIRTLLLTATLESDDESDKEVSSEAVVAAVQKSLKKDADAKSSKTSCRPPKLEGDNKRYFCEMWASSPAPLPLRPVSGYHSKISISEEDWDDKAADAMKQYGIVTQNNILDKEEVAELRGMVDKAIENVEALIATHRPNITIGEDFFTFEEIASRNLERFDLRLDTVPGAAEYVEKYICCNPGVKSILTMLGSPDEIDFDISVVYSKPGAINQRWHADGKHEEGDEAYALCLFIPLIDLDYEVGYTQFWPGSHKCCDLVGYGPIAELTKATFDGICESGSGVWYDYRLLHRGMFNVSHVIRPVVQVIFKKKWYVERRNYGKQSIVREE